MRGQLRGQLAAPPRKPLHCIREVAAAIDKAPKTVYLAILAGKIRAVRLGWAWAIPDHELRKILEHGY